MLKSVLVCIGSRPLPTIAVRVFLALARFLQSLHYSTYRQARKLGDFTTKRDSDPLARVAVCVDCEALVIGVLALLRGRLPNTVVGGLLGLSLGRNIINEIRIWLTLPRDLANRRGGHAAIFLVLAVLVL